METVFVTVIHSVDNRKALDHNVRGRTFKTKSDLWKFLKTIGISDEDDLQVHSPEEFAKYVNSGGMYLAWSVTCNLKN